MFSLKRLDFFDIHKDENYSLCKSDGQDICKGSQKHTCLFIERYGRLEILG